MSLGHALSEAARIYGAGTPYHRGKDRLLQPVLRLPAVARHDAGREVEATRQGMHWSLALDCLVQRAVYYLGCYEAWETQALLRMVAPGHVVMDVGANFGYYTLLAARAVGSAGRVVACEAAPTVLERLRRNVSRNGLANVTIVPEAVSSAAGELTFIAPAPGNMGHGRVAGSAGQGTGERRIRVPATTLDAIVAAERLERVDLVKIDVEGAELSVLDGAAETLDRFRPALMVEINPEALGDMGHATHELIARLEALSYRLHRATPAGLRPFDGHIADGGYVNVVALADARAPRIGVAVPPGFSLPTAARRRATPAR